MDEKVTKTIAKYKQWVIGTTRPHGPVLTKPGFGEHPERNYDLKNTAIKRFLQNEDQTYGINLGWTDDASEATGKRVARWFFTRKGNAEGPLKYGEHIALGNGTRPSFVNYEHRTVGINLDYANTPPYEWMVLGGKIGDPVKTHDAIALYNAKCEDCLIYFNRTRGADIGWPDSKTWVGQLGDLTGLGEITEAAWKEVQSKALAALLTAVMV